MMLVCRFEISVRRQTQHILEYKAAKNRIYCRGLSSRKFGFGKTSVLCDFSILLIDSVLFNEIHS